MKKLILILIMLPFFGLAQSGARLHYDQLVTADTITADTGYILTTSADYTYFLNMSWASTTTSTTTVTLQTTGNNGSSWIAAPGFSAITLNSVSGETAWQGAYMPGYKYRMYVDVTATETIIVDAWYTLKVRPR